MVTKQQTSCNDNIYIFFFTIHKKKTSTNALMSVGTSSHFFTPLPSPKPQLPQKVKLVIM